MSSDMEGVKPSLGRFSPGLSPRLSPSRVTFPPSHTVPRRGLVRETGRVYPFISPSLFPQSFKWHAAASARVPAALRHTHNHTHTHAPQMHICTSVINNDEAPFVTFEGEWSGSTELLGKDWHCQTFFFSLWKICWCWKAGDFFSRYVVMETNIWLRTFSTEKWSYTLWAHTLGKDFMLVSPSKVFSPLRKGSHPETKECEGQPAGFLLEAGGSGLRPCPVISQICDAHLKHLHTSLLCFPQTVGEMGSATLWGKPGNVLTSYYSFARRSHPAAFVRLSHDRILIREWIHSMPNSVLTL